jgi:hypothetical protein
MIAFAVIVAHAGTRLPLSMILPVAAIAWAVIALGGYFIAHRLGAGGDEPDPMTSAPGPRPDR